MKIILLANKDLASNYALNLLLPLLKNHELYLFLSAKVGGNSKKPNELNRLKFFEQDLFNLLVSPNLKHPQDRDSTSRSFAQMQELLCQPFQELNDINSAAGIQLIEQIKSDLIISIRYGVILKEPIISLPKHGVINLHSGLLPEYRGVMATFWAMLNQEKIIGTTLHYIDDSKIDTGRKIQTTQLNVDTKKSYLWHVLRLYENGVKLIADTVNKISTQQEINAINSESTGSYFSFPTAIELQQFIDLGFELINEQDYLEFIQNNYY
jgi:methionyl-tRNA formyltransferase